MITSFSPDPLSNLSRRDKRAWRAAERRVLRDHETFQLQTLRDLAAVGCPVRAVSLPAPGDDPSETCPFELVLEGRRIRAARGHRQTLVELGEAAALPGGLALAGAGRYGGYWVLTFDAPELTRVVLAHQVTVLPGWQGPGGSSEAPTGPLASLSA